MGGMAPNEIQALATAWDVVNKIGLPVVIVYGLIKGWWYPKTFVEFIKQTHADVLTHRDAVILKLEEQLEKANAQVERARENEAKATEYAAKTNEMVEDLMARVELLTKDSR